MKSYIPPHRRNEIKNGVNKLIDYHRRQIILMRPQ